MSNYIARKEEIRGLHGETIHIEHHVDSEGRPAGGKAYGTGLSLTFQDGPVLESGLRNGCFIEDLFMVAASRLDFYNSGDFACRENSLAKTAVQDAENWLNRRTLDRRARGVEGRHQQ